MASPLERLLEYVDDLDDVVPEASKVLLDEMESHIEAEKQWRLRLHRDHKKELESLQRELITAEQRALLADQQALELERATKDLAAMGKNQLFAWKCPSFIISPRSSRHLAQRATLRPKILASLRSSLAWLKRTGG